MSQKQALIEDLKQPLKQKGYKKKNQTQERIPTRDKFGGCLMADKLIPVLEAFETWYGTPDALRRKAIEGKLPAMSCAKAVTYLTSVRLG